MRICRAWGPQPATSGWLGGFWLLAFYLTAMPPLATAQAQPRQPNTSIASSAAKERASQSTAHAHFEAALQHYRARRFREAIREFELSLADMPSAELWFDIARAHEQLGEYGLAVENYRLYLRDRVDAPDAQEVAHRIDTLAARADAARVAKQQRAGVSAALAIDAAQPGSLVLLDGQQLGIAPLDRIVEVSPGPHRLDVTRAGYVPFRAEVEVQTGALSAAYVDMRPLTRPRDPVGSRFWTWCAATASAAALLSSGALGIQAIQRRDAGDLHAARDWARASDLVLGGALGLAVAATVLYFSEGHDYQGSRVALRTDSKTASP